MVSKKKFLFIYFLIFSWENHDIGFVRLYLSSIFLEIVLYQINFFINVLLRVLGENVHLRIGYFLCLDPRDTVTRPVTKCDSGCYYVANTSTPGFPRAII